MKKLNYFIIFSILIFLFGNTFFVSVEGFTLEEIANFDVDSLEEPNAEDLDLGLDLDNEALDTLEGLTLNMEKNNRELNKLIEEFEEFEADSQRFDELDDKENPSYEERVEYKKLAEKLDIKSYMVELGLIDDEMPNVFDEANLTDSDDEEFLQGQIENIRALYRAHVYVYTKESMEGKKLDYWANKLLEKHDLSKKGNPDLNAVIAYFKQDNALLVAGFKEGRLPSEVLYGVAYIIVEGIDEENYGPGIIGGLSNLTLEMERLDKSLLDFLKNEEKESYKKLVEIYLDEGRIDKSLLLENYLRTEFDYYKKSKDRKYKDLDDFVEKRNSFIEDLNNLKYDFVKFDNLHLLKDESYDLLDISDYNKGYANVVHPFDIRKIQCRSGTRLFITNAFSILNEELSSDLLIIYTSGHTLPGMIQEGVLIGLESTQRGESYVIFGKVKEDKSLEGVDEQVIAVKADHALFYDVLSEEELLKEKVKRESVVVYNKGEIINQEAGSELSGGSQSVPQDMYSFGHINVKAGDRKMTSGEVRNFQGSEHNYNLITTGGDTGESSGEGRTKKGSQIDFYEEEGKSKIKYEVRDFTQCEKAAIFFQSQLGNTPGSGEGFSYKGFWNPRDAYTNTNDQTTFAVFIHDEISEQFSKEYLVKIDWYQSGDYLKTLYNCYTGIPLTSRTSNTYYLNKNGEKVSFTVKE